MSGDGEWFAPKRYGYGAGRPIAWQGWAVIAVWAAAVAAAVAPLSPRHPALAGILAVIVSIPMMVIAARHTRGGWKWRWGGED